MIVVAGVPRRGGKVQKIRPGWGHTPRNAYFSGGWRERRGRSGAGEWREFDEVGTDGTPPRTPEVTGGGGPAPRLWQGCRELEAAISMGSWLSIGEAILV